MRFEKISNSAYDGVFHEERSNDKEADGRRSKSIKTPTGAWGQYI